LILELVLSLKLRAIGNSMGFSLPKAALSEAGFDQDGEYELLVSEGAISIVRKGPSSSTWKFTDAPLTDEHREWIERELE